MNKYTLRINVFIIIRLILKNKRVYSIELFCLGKCRMYNKLDILHTIEFFCTLCNTEQHQESHYNYLLYIFIKWLKCTYQVIEVWWYIYTLLFNTLRLRQNDCHFADNIFECIEWKLSNFNYNLTELCMAALVQVMVWPQTGDKPLSEPIMI